MTLLVVALSPERAGDLTLDEWDALTGRSLVLFERADHPLIDRLAAAGVAAGPFDDEPAADAAGWAFVTEPDSPRLVELARRGAEVLSSSWSPPDALTAARGAAVGRRAARSMAGLASVMARLRSPEGCPWDREQDHRSLAPHLLEEAYEVIDAIEREAPDAELEEELGDLLLQVVFHAQMAHDAGRFDVADVADTIVAKLLHRHPHVFSDAVVESAGQVVANWEAIKATEKKRSGPFDDIPTALPALAAAHKTQKRAAALGFAPSDAEALERAGDALASGDLGEALFWSVALARSRGVDAEGALRAATRRFRERQAPPGL
ncbi:MAG: nucleoside triphosphate pyrophosphohydrolase [Actinomycetota bacterium]|nr:nucleoside triphosphate pyrophosphohydrolase [Actinomycetota bacterium]